MTLDEIKLQVQNHLNCSAEKLNAEIVALKTKGVSFLGCVAFVQTNQQLSLPDAYKTTMALPAFDAERTRIIEAKQVMLDDLKKSKIK